MDQRRSRRSAYIQGRASLVTADASDEIASSSIAITEAHHWIAFVQPSDDKKCKGTERLEKILQDHVLDFDIEEVWYFVKSDVVRRHLMRVAEVYDSVRIFSLSDDVIAGLPKELGFE